MAQLRAQFVPPRPCDHDGTFGTEYCLGGRPVTTRHSNVWPCDNISGLGPETWSYWSRGLITRRFRTSQGPCKCGLVQVISGLGPDDIDQIGHKAL